MFLIVDDLQGRGRLAVTEVSMQGTRCHRHVQARTKWVFMCFKISAHCIIGHRSSEFSEHHARYAFKGIAAGYSDTIVMIDLYQSHGILLYTLFKLE